MKRYIAKSDCWFDQDTEADLIDDYRPEVQSGLFFGMKDGHLTYQICNFDEFKIVYLKVDDE